MQRMRRIWKRMICCRIWLVDSTHKKKEGIMDTNLSNLGWRFWGRWLVATTVAWVVGFIAAIALSYLVVNAFYPEESNLIVGLCMGAALAIGQPSGWIPGSRG